MKSISSDWARSSGINSARERNWSKPKPSPNDNKPKPFHSVPNPTDKITLLNFKNYPTNPDGFFVIKLKIEGRLSYCSLGF